MGEEIAQEAFAPADFARFADRLRAETETARGLFRSGSFSNAGYQLGFEIEAWLLDHAYGPRPINEEFLAALDHPLVVPELSRFNVEFNCEPLTLAGGVFSKAAAGLSALWRHCNEVAHGLDASVVLIGTLPTIGEADLTLANISPLKRYHALNHELLRRRHGRPLRIDIDGDDRLQTEHGDVMLEAATTSFQVHLKTPAALAHRFYNASLIASGPVMAMSGNAPFLFGRALWEETRIPLFEQAVDLVGAHAGTRRVTFGSGYADGSLLPWLEENLDAYPVLLPLAFDEPDEALRHIRLHNGTIWRWNRPLIGFDDDGTPHLRIEHRIMPAGPTVLDMIANAAFYIGLVRNLVDTGFDADGAMPFAVARGNFYAAARHGLDARLAWPRRGSADPAELIRRDLIARAREGLAEFGIAADDAEFYLDIVEARVRTGQTGARWQRRHLAACDGDALRLMADYCERQRSGNPVHEWES